jgi:putative transposase
MARTQFVNRRAKKGPDRGVKWLWTYNNDRPNMGIGGITPAMKLNQYQMAA